MRLYKQTPETSLGAEVDHQAPLFIDTHAGWVQRPCGNKQTRKDEDTNTPDSRVKADVFRDQKP